MTQPASQRNRYDRNTRDLEFMQQNKSRFAGEVVVEQFSREHWRVHYDGTSVDFWPQTDKQQTIRGPKKLSGWSKTGLRGVFEALGAIAPRRRDGFDGPTRQGKDRPDHGSPYKSDTNSHIPEGKRGRR